MRLNDTEATHRRLYDAHWNIVAAANHIHAVIVEMHAAGRHEDGRKKLAPSLAELENARRLLDEAMMAANTGRSDLFRATGCDGTCSEAAMRKMEA